MEQPRNPNGLSALNDHDLEMLLRLDRFKRKLSDPEAVDCISDLMKSVVNRHETKMANRRL